MRQIRDTGDLLAADMLATVSHEMRNPLAIIQGAAQTLLRHDQRLSPEERQEFVLAITQANERLEQIVDDMLELSQLEAGTYLFEAVPLYLPALLQDVSQIAVSLDGAGREVLVQTAVQDGENPPELPSLQVYGDRRLLRRFLSHALRNAFLYSPDESQVEVGLRLFLETESRLTAHQNQLADERAVIVELPSALTSQPLLDLWIRDSGLGIAPEHLPRVSERFYRADTRLTRERNGLGLGLTICKQIAELHNSGFWIESKVDKGTVLHLELPVI